MKSKAITFLLFLLALAGSAMGAATPITGYTAGDNPQPSRSYFTNSVIGVIDQVGTRNPYWTNTAFRAMCLGNGTPHVIAEDTFTRNASIDLSQTTRGQRWQVTTNVTTTPTTNADWTVIERDNGLRMFTPTNITSYCYLFWTNTAPVTQWKSSPHAVIHATMQFTRQLASNTIPTGVESSCNITLCNRLNWTEALHCNFNGYYSAIQVSTNAVGGLTTLNGMASATIFDNGAATGNAFTADIWVSHADYLIRVGTNLVAGTDNLVGQVWTNGMDCGYFENTHNAAAQFQSYITYARIEIIY